MRLLAKIFSAFCVATILAQVAIVGMSLASGNVGMDSVWKGVALLNGIDITGDQLQKMFNKARQEPVPTYDEVLEARARLDKNLQMREEAVRREMAQLQDLRTRLEINESDFDQRKNDFYSRIDASEAELLTDSIKEVQKMLESLVPEQAKDQLLKLWESDRKADVASIVKAMADDKRKKVLGEFIDQREAEVLNEILTLRLDGEPQATLYKNARATAGK